MKVSLKYNTLLGSTYYGIPALTLTTGTTEVTDHVLLDTIRTMAETFKMKLKILTIEVDSDFNTEDSILLSNVLYSLSDWVKIGIIYQPYLPSFIREFNYLIAVVYDTHWHKYKANEIWYTPKERIEEIDPGSINTATPKFIYPSSSFKLQEALDFMTNSSYLYGMIQPPKKSIEVTLL